MSVYGSPLWNFEHYHCKKFYVAWRKCIRRFFALPYTTHSRLLYLICDDLPVDMQLHLRFLKFIDTCKNSSNPLISFMYKLSENNPLSNISQSMSYICSTYNLNRVSDLYNPGLIKNQYYQNIKESDAGTAQFILDLLSIGNKDECVTEIISYLCTN